MRTPLLRRLSFRVRLLCVAVFFTGALLPPYVPSNALSSDDVPSQTPQYMLVEDGFLMKSSSLADQGTRLAYSEGLVHTVQTGENIEKIAQQYHISAKTILWANNLEPGATIRPGQEIVVLPVDGVLHTVRRGQTLSRIAQLYDVPQEDIARQNKIKGSFIVSGEQLVIPGAKPIIGGESAIASADEALRFTDRLPSKDIQLKLKGGGGDGGGGNKQAPDAQVAPTAGILQMPCNNCSYTQYYHPGHYAVDIQTRGGGPIFASEDGVVIRADYGWDGGYGNVIEIDHGNGLVTLYGHNKELYVQVGDRVKRGQVISFMGHTGLVYGATGIHVHFEVRVDGVKKNPLLYLE